MQNPVPESGARQRGTIRRKLERQRDIRKTPDERRRETTSYKLWIFLEVVVPLGFGVAYICGWV